MCYFINVVFNTDPIHNIYGQHFRKIGSVAMGTITVIIGLASAGRFLRSAVKCPSPSPLRAAQGALDVHRIHRVGLQHAFQAWRRVDDMRVLIAAPPGGSRDGAG